MNEIAAVPASFVVFSLGERRFAIPTAEVVELFRSGIVQTFPHQTPDLEGIMLRRGEILPVWAAARSLAVQADIEWNFWLIARRHFAGEERTAIPVSGECQMIQAEMHAPPEGSSAYVRGVLRVGDQTAEVLDLGRLENQQGRGVMPECGPDGEGTV